MRHLEVKLVLSEFLEAGKTNLLNYILNSTQGLITYLSFKKEIKNRNIAGGKNKKWPIYISIVWHKQQLTNCPE